ncbi:MAG: hypothetical protein LBS55_08210 [Prevotellaceae bacterium]|jgi:hypothetical protein|nr:hypothetical protein [Prevotellaceae bacterium]
MKKVLCTVAALCMWLAAFSQETETVTTAPQYEIKLNLINTLILFPEISFEYHLKDDLGMGLALATSLNGGEPYNVQLTPYFRFYFGNKPAKMFFIEANAALVGLQDDTYYYDYSHDDPSYLDVQYRNQTVTDFGLGFAVGYKFFNKKGFTGEIYGGMGRTFGDRAYPRVGICIGKQF